MMSSYKFRKAGVAVVACALLFASFAFARSSMNLSESDMMRRVAARSHVSSLDDEWTQMRYSKTTDFGATWITNVVAGDLTTFAPQTTSFPDFSPIMTASGELCYVVYLANAAVPGVYSMTGPGFAPVLVMAKGTTGMDSVKNGGWTDAGKTPNGDLWAMIWGQNGGYNTIWVAKSTNNGTSWGTPFVAATNPALPTPASLYPHISQMNSASTLFILYQDATYAQYVLRVPTAGGVGAVTTVGATSGSEFSYYTGNVEPIAYDPNSAPPALFVVCRGNPAGAGVMVYYSSNDGTSFTGSTPVSGPERYPSIYMRTSDQTPWVSSNNGASGDPHIAWVSHDEFGYNGGGWTGHDTSAFCPNDGVLGLLYQQTLYFWDNNRGIAGVDYWGNTPAITPAGNYTSRTTDGGATWIDVQQRWFFRDPAVALEWSTCGGSEVMGAPNGVGYQTFSGRVGDVVGPVFDPLLLITPATQLPPYVVSCQILDGTGVDTTTVTLNYYSSEHGDTLYSVAADSFHWTDHSKWNGTYFFTIPLSIGGTNVVNGETIYFYCDGSDIIANYGTTPEDYVVVGSHWVGVDDRPNLTANTFALNGNYPNPFNPSTRISFDLPAAYRTTLRVFNTLGQEVAVLARGEMLTQGHHEVAFNGMDLPTGVYFYTLTAGPYSATQKMVLLK